MHDWLGSVIYMATAPIRLFGRSRAFRWSLLALVVLGGSFAATHWALERLTPERAAPALAKLKPLPPLPPVTRASYVIAPVAISLAAIRDSLDAAAPRTLVGEDDNPVSSFLSKADIGITVTRGALEVSGKPDDLAVTAPLNSTLRVTGQIAGVAGNLTGTLTGFIDSGLGRNVGSLTSKVLDQRADVRGRVIVHARPSIAANWRLDPHLSAQLALGSSALTLAGFKIDMANEARLLIDRLVNQQVAELQTRLANDPFIERAARAQWAKMCRAIPLGGGSTGLPQLWLEMRPIRAAAAQPKIDGRDVTLTIGVQAETRITPTESKPNCPFPAKLELVPPMDDGRLEVGVPIDVPFTALGNSLAAQLKGRRFPDDPHAAAAIEVRHVTIGASGDRLLMVLDVKAREQKSWFGFGANATLQIWGKPVLDPQNQTLRLTDVSLAVDSQAAFGLIGAAAQAALPYLQQALADNAVIDLKPFAADALKKIGAALAGFEQDRNGVRVKAEVKTLRLTGIAFDSHTLRVIAQADGEARGAVSQLPRM